MTASKPTASRSVNLYSDRKVRPPDLGCAEPPLVDSTNTGTGVTRLVRLELAEITRLSRNRLPDRNNVNLPFCRPRVPDRFAMPVVPVPADTPPLRPSTPS